MAFDTHSLANSLPFGRTITRELTGAVEGTVNEALRLTNVTLNAPDEHKVHAFLISLLKCTTLPEFVDDINDPSDALTEANRAGDNVDWAAIPSDGLTRPLRMFDIDTQNMVDTTQLTSADQYCVLSHSWKGAEINYTYFTSATKENDAIASLAVLDGEEGEQQQQEIADVGLLERRCFADLVAAIERLGGQELAEEHLADHLRKKTQQRKFTEAMNEEEKTRRDFKTKEQQQEHAERILRGMGCDPEKSDLSQWSTKAKAAWHNADKTRDEKLRQGTPSLSGNRSIFYARETLLECLQRRKSLRKLKQAIKHTKYLFEERPFLPAEGKRYVWLDTCCINKADGDELSKSLALMGEWYTNADFCLVHLDESFSDQEWRDELIAHGRGKSVTEIPEVIEPESKTKDKANQINSKEDKLIPAKLIRHFWDIIKADIPWATRGWTLQELVLSKMTFYVNPDWELLDRGIDQLGSYYYVTPFMEHYLNNITPVSPDFATEFYRLWHCNGDDEDNGEVVDDEDGDVRTAADNARDTVKFRKLAAALESVGFTVPKFLSSQSATAQIEWAVDTCATKLCSDNPDINSIEEVMQLLEDPKEHREKGSGNGFNESSDEDPRINGLYRPFLRLLLEKLRDSALTAIRQDLVTISKFGKISELHDWTLGAGPANFSAFSVLTTSASRNTTVATDKAYCLMGILNVKFPAFPAEGLSKALSRLFDEVVIASSDVSVFNWSGKYYGSTIQGRSLYPSRIEAYQDRANSGNATNDVNKKLLDIFSAKQNETMKVAWEVESLLIQMLKLVKPLNHENVPQKLLNDLDGVIETLKTKSLNNLEEDRKTLRDLKKQISECSDLFEQESSKAEATPDSSRSNHVEDAEKGSTFFMPSVSIPTLEIKSPLHIPRTFSRPWGEKKPPMAVLPTPPEEPDRVTEIFTNLAKSMEKGFEALRGFPSQDDDEEDEERDAAAFLDPDAQHDDAPLDVIDRRTRCNNPIVVSSSGISGTFDVQRVVVTMIDPEALRAQIRRAVSGQKIEGWCRVSTGFAYTLVNFSCDRDMLQQQLDMTEVNEKCLLSVSEATTPGPEGSTSMFARQRLRKMIDMVQEPNLHAVAGEWVLARFSDVPTADWFLSRLELGAGRGFYARRIATDAFTFANAIPEQGLNDYWHQFMTDKKEIACKALHNYLQGKRIRRNTGDFFHNLQSNAEVPIIDSLTLIIEKMAEGVVWVGDFALRAVADHMRHHITRSAMERIPPKVQAAVQDLNARKGLFPTIDDRRNRAFKNPYNAILISTLKDARSRNMVYSVSVKICHL
ncbi:hypothetical protein BO94DRAFT_621946 [Aspergillus sclerotioniger CBS 115572]|uniref:Heterokaryon incompatibility domain-containing protein n=1 Tax=Aspergillus sclerotioniger CBS 115572 TaxID=1450535 RepID=A0A317X9I8_9EURO|nr:hypothetical protein BO94DRAFT_621946 [Aspergillus sclerotioniger CBS 115572]PWY93568.1 hypothetical protein BO94DRAFT_621946 [Aspergillus sclerotioniger CBS 115572]